MPVVRDPGSLTYIVGGSDTVRPVDVRRLENDLFRAFHSMTKQLGPVMTRRLDKAIFYRARYKKAVAL